MTQPHVRVFGGGGGHGKTTKPDLRMFVEVLWVPSPWPLQLPCPVHEPGRRCAGPGALVGWRPRPVMKALTFHWLEAPPQNPVMVPRSFFWSCLN